MEINTCGREWSRKFIYDNFTQSFLHNEYKIQRENVLYDQERALMIETQPFVECAIKKEKIKSEISNIQTVIFNLHTEIKKLYGEYNELSKIKEMERQIFVRSCPSNGCNGFLSQSWKCGICENWFCKNCHQCKGNSRNNEQHVCDPNDVSTVQLLENDTKPCPKCQMGIFKIDGCNQMFCTNCNTAFDWTTRKITNGIIHNPHYFEWLRRNDVNNNTRDNTNNINVCIERREITQLTSRNINVFLQRMHDLSEFEKKNYMISIGSIIRNIIHIRLVMLPIYQTDNYIEKNRNLRIQFMRKQITETDFKINIQRNEKKNKKYEEIYNALQIMTDTCSDIILRCQDYFYGVIHSTNSSIVFEKTKLQNILDEIPEMIKYINECFIEISKTYNSKVIVFNNLLEQIYK
jgi:hypothetical protein